MEMGLYEREVALAYDPFVGGNVVLESFPIWARLELWSRSQPELSEP
jgi:hypothetical protein